MADAPLKVLIVDDEAPARRRLRELLDDCTTALPLVVVGEAASGREALTLLGSTPTDLVLSDIHMPDMDGIELARHLLKLPVPPVLIFTTAYHEHAIAAFEVHAVDYLLKPFSAERFAQALERASVRLGTPRTVAAPVLAQAARGPGSHLERLVIRDGAEIVIIPLDSVDYVKGQDDYVEVFHGARSSLTQQTLQSLEASLDPAHFVRVHRSYVLNVRRVARLEPWGHGSKLAVLHDGRTVPVSRAGEARLKAVLGV